MSIERVADVLRHSRAKGTDKVVLIGIANHDGDGGAWPSIETLSGYANVDRRSVQRAISNLVALGELEVVPQAGGTSMTRADRRTNLYRITLNDGVTSMPPRGTSGTERGDIRDANGVTSVTPRGDAHAALTVLEPSTEPSSVQERSLAALANLIQPDIDTEMFNCFWDVYPRHAGGRPIARKAWDKAIKVVQPVVIVNAALKFREDPNREDQFTPHPSTWLNQHRWEDDPLPARATATSGTSLYLATADGWPGYEQQIAIEEA